MKKGRTAEGRNGGKGGRGERGKRGTIGCRDYYIENVYPHLGG